MLDYTSGMYVYAGTFDASYSESALLSVLAAIRTEVGQDVEKAVSDMRALLTNGFSMWGSVPVSSKMGPYGEFDWFGTIDGLEGAKPYLLVSSHTIEELDSSSFLALTSVDGLVVGEHGTINVGLTTGTNHWDQEFWGFLGGWNGTTYENIQMEAIPEPQTYALTAGAIILLGALLQRRMRAPR